MDQKDGEKAFGRHNQPFKRANGKEIDMRKKRYTEREQQYIINTDFSPRHWVEGGMARVATAYPQQDPKVTLKVLRAMLELSGPSEWTEAALLVLAEWE